MWQGAPRPDPDPTITRIRSLVQPLSNCTKQAYAGRSHRIDQKARSERGFGLAARLGDDETTVAGGTVKSSVLGGGRRVVISTNWIAGAQPLPFQGIFQDLRESAAYFDKTSKGALVSRRSGVDEYPDRRGTSPDPRR